VYFSFLFSLEIPTSGTFAAEFSPILNSGVVLFVISLSFTGTRIARNFSPISIGFPEKVRGSPGCLGEPLTNMAASQ
jgi:hypothetical protein